jgi:hypothetical protein
MFRTLSYPLNKDAPVWPGNPAAAQTEAYESIAKGDVANTTVLHLFSHSGTHLDAPKYFNNLGSDRAMPSTQRSCHRRHFYWRAKFSKSQAPDNTGFYV